MDDFIKLSQLGTIIDEDETALSLAVKINFINAIQEEEKNAE